MTGQETRDYIVRKFKRTDKDTEIYESITDMIADMRRKFMSEEFSEEAFLQGIDTLGQYRLAVPTDFGSIIGSISLTDTADDSSYNNLIKLSKQRYDELYTDRLLTTVGNVHTALPRHFCVYGNQLFLGPVPDKTTYRYQINYSTEAFTAVTSVTADVPFSDKYRNVLRHAVLMDLHDGMENYQESSIWEDKYNRGLAVIASAESSNKQSEDLVQYHGI